MLESALHCFKPVWLFVFLGIIVASPFVALGIAITTQLAKSNCRVVALLTLEQYPGGLTASQLSYKMRHSMRIEMYEYLMPEDIEPLLEKLRAAGRVDVVETAQGKRWHSRPKT